MHHVLSEDDGVNRLAAVQANHHKRYRSIRDKKERKWGSGAGQMCCTIPFLLLIGNSVSVSISVSISVSVSVSLSLSLSFSISLPFSLSLSVPPLLLYPTWGEYQDSVCVCVCLCFQRFLSDNRSPLLFYIWS